MNTKCLASLAKQHLQKKPKKNIALNEVHTNNPPKASSNDVSGQTGFVHSAPQKTQTNN
jgi:hypothetical protein